MPCYCDSTYHADGRCVGANYSPLLARLEADYRREKDSGGPFEVILGGKVVLTGTLGECQTYRNRMERAERFQQTYFVRPGKVG